MRKTFFLVAVLVALVPATTSAQSADIDAELRIKAAIEQAASAGVPGWLLENKVREGRAKGVAAASIAAAIEHRADVLARVRTALLEGSQPAFAEALTAGELTAAADAHERGVSLDGLSAISARAGQDRAVALVVLADLVASGRASENALMRVEAAFARGPRGLAELRGSADVRAGAAVRAGTPAGGARGEARVGLSAGRSGS